MSRTPQNHSSTSILHTATFKKLKATCCTRRRYTMTERLSINKPTPFFPPNSSMKPYSCEKLCPCRPSFCLLKSPWATSATCLSTQGHSECCNTIILYDVLLEIRQIFDLIMERQAMNPSDAWVCQVYKNRILCWTTQDKCSF